jgi:hypothetical protein
MASLVLGSPWAGGGCARARGGLGPGAAVAACRVKGTGPAAQPAGQPSAACAPVPRPAGLTLPALPVDLPLHHHVPWHPGHAVPAAAAIATTAGAAAVRPRQRSVAAAAAAAAADPPHLERLRVGAEVEPAVVELQGAVVKVHRVHLGATAREVHGARARRRRARRGARGGAGAGGEQATAVGDGGGAAAAEAAAARAERGRRAPRQAAASSRGRPVGPARGKGSGQ